MRARNRMIVIACTCLDVAMSVLAMVSHWLLGADGGVFTFGDAGFVGSLGGQSIGAPIVSFAPV